MNRQTKKIRLISATVLAFSLMAASGAYAQTPPPPPPGEAMTKAAPAPPPLPDRPGTRHPMPPGAEAGRMERDALQPVTAFSGTVVRFLTNDDFVYDGFLVRNGNDSFRVHFPPAEGKVMMKSLRPGAAVSLRGVERQNPAGVREIEMTAIGNNGNMTEIQPPAELPVPAAPVFTQGSGRITGFGQDREGRPNALLLDDNRVLRLPPAAWQTLGQPPVTGATIAYTGTLRSAVPGEVPQNDSRIIRCRTITINGQQYLTGPR